MKSIKKLFFSTLMLLVSTVALAQTQATGKVVDENGEPIIGATILQKGTTKGAVSDLDGNFNINVPSRCTLQISYVGYKTEIVNYAGQGNLNVSMKVEYWIQRQENQF